MQSGTAVADLRARREGRPIVKTRGRGGAARTLRDVLVHLAILVGTRTEALHRSDDHARIELLNSLPRKTHSIEATRRKVFHQHIPVLDKLLEHFLAALALRIDSHPTLVLLQHGQIET